MDRTLLSRPRRKSSSKSKKRRSRGRSPTSRHEVVPEPPQADTEEPSLDDVVSKEVSGVKLNKAEAGPQRVIEEDAKSEASAPASEAEEQEQEEAPAPPKEEDVVTAQEVLKTAETLAPVAEKTKRRNRGGNGGDFGAAYNEL